MIEIRNLKKTFGDIQVLNDINLTIARGDIFGLVGRSGAGKSTLLRCINGLESYDEGSLLVDGVDVKSLGDRERREFRKEIGMIFQHFSLFSRMTVYENIALPMSCWKYNRAHIDRRVNELSELVGIPDKLRAKPGELSGGQKQRVAIARALAMNPKILLCDEATSALDPQTAKSIIALLNAINADLGITIVIVTHQMSVLRSSCEHIAILEGGRMADNGQVESIFIKQPQSLRNLIGTKDMMLPSTGVNLRILLAKDTANQPIITRMARDLKLDFLILGGEMEQYRRSVLGSVIINVAEQSLPAVTQYLEQNQVAWKLIDYTELSNEQLRGGELSV